MQSGGASSSSNSMGWSLTKEAVERHVDEVLRDSATVRRLVKALNEVGHSCFAAWTLHWTICPSAWANNKASAATPCFVSAVQLGCPARRDRFTVVSCDTKTGGGFSIEHGVSHCRWKGMQCWSIRKQSLILTCWPAWMDGYSMLQPSLGRQSATLRTQGFVR